MALNGNVCGTAIKNALISSGVQIADEPACEAIMQTMCTEIFSHIIANGVVTIPGSTFSTGSYPGPGVTLVVAPVPLAIS